MRTMSRVFSGSIGLLLVLGAASPAAGQAFGRLEGLLETNASVYIFARPGDATKRVYVWGAVLKPGLYEVVTDTDLSALLSLAGGPIRPIRTDEVQQRVTLRLHEMEGSVRRLTYEASVDSLLQRDLPMPGEGDVVEILISQHRIRSWRDNAGLVSAGASILTVLITLATLLR